MRTAFIVHKLANRRVCESERDCEFNLKIEIMSTSVHRYAIGFYQKWIDINAKNSFFAVKHLKCSSKCSAHWILCSISVRFSFFSVAFVVFLLQLLLILLFLVKNRIHFDLNANNYLNLLLLFFCSKSGRWWHISQLFGTQSGLISGKCFCIHHFHI